MFEVGKTYLTMTGRDAIVVYKCTDGRYVCVTRSIVGREYAYTVNDKGRSIDGQASLLIPDPTEGYFV